MISPKEQTVLVIKYKRFHVGRDKFSFKYLYVLTVNRVIDNDLRGTEENVLPIKFQTIILKKVTKEIKTIE